MGQEVGTPTFFDSKRGKGVPGSAAISMAPGQKKALLGENSITAINPTGKKDWQQEEAMGPEGSVKCFVR